MSSKEAAVTESAVANEGRGRKRVNIIEKISVTFSSSGCVLSCEIKNEKLFNWESRNCASSQYDKLYIGIPNNFILDDCNFHESVRMDRFDVDRTLSLVLPPDEEFAVMNYRTTQEFKPPFIIEEAGSHEEAEVILKIRAEFPSIITANIVLVQMPLPACTTRVNFDLERGIVEQNADFNESQGRLEWSVEKIVGGSEHSLRAKLNFSQELDGNISKEAGPVSMTFTIPNYNPSRLQVKYVWIEKKTGISNPYRRVRYVTRANSYVAQV